MNKNVKTTTKRRPFRYDAKRHRFRVGDVVGVTADCMAECEILEIIPKKKGQSHSYVAEAIKINHPKPYESFFGQNKKFVLKDNQILLRISKQNE